MLIGVCIKFHEYSLSGFQVIEHTRFVTDRQTDGQTDAWGKSICFPTLKRGDIISQDETNNIVKTYSVDFSDFATPPLNFFTFCFQFVANILFLMAIDMF